MAVKRSEVKQEDTWNLDPCFTSTEDWDALFNEVNPRGTESPHWPKILSFKGRLSEGAEVLKELLELMNDIERNLDKLHTYAHLRLDENLADDVNKSRNEKITTLYHDYVQEISWFDPELLGLSDEKIQEILDDPILADFRFLLEKTVRLKPHTLGEKEEELLALSHKAMGTASKAFSSLNNADFKFGVVLDKDGKEHELTHASYGLFLRSQDRVLRKNAFLGITSKYSSYENTLCDLLSGQVDSHHFSMKARNYDSCLQSSLFGNNIDRDVYTKLIESVRSEIPALHDYVDFRKNVLNLDAVHLYDMSVPLTSNVDIKMSYKEAEDIVIESVAPLGSEYQNALRKGLKDERWVDRYENEGKRSGAYSSGSYDTQPYILMNYKGILRDVFTLAHEAGHSMHSYSSNATQAYHYSSYSIFVAEVASTFNEALLLNTLLEQRTSKEERIFLINQQVEDIRATLFRQVQFAEFELFIHEMTEQQIPLTTGLLKEEYQKLNEFYFGKSAICDIEGKIEWARIPHFYYNFYVYQYAIGISAALALVQQVLEGDDSDRQRYLSFLKGGSSKFPIDLLKEAGVDMCSPAPVKTAIGTFRSRVEELKSLMNL
jgi:oligoendopeptidase F